MGRSIHAGQVTRRRRHGSWPREKLERVLTNDPGMGVIRHVDAGYEHATAVAAERGVRIPMQEKRIMELRRPFDSLWDSILDVGRERRHRRLPPIRLDDRRSHAARVVHR